MKRLLVSLVTAILITVSLLPLSVAAQSPTHVTGGGTATFGADLDGDGDVDGSQFGLGVVIHEDGTARGHFNCVMAGRSRFLGLSLMSVAGRVTDGVINADVSATLSGFGTVNLGNQGRVRDVPFAVSITAGGPGEGTMQLSVIHPDFDGLPGDTNIGNGQFDLPLETVSSGRINIH